MQNNVTADKTKGNGNGKWMAKTAVSEAEEQITHFQESAREIYDRAVKSGSDLISKANRKAGAVVREYPMQTAIGGLVLGFLLGASLFRRRS